MTLMGLFAVAIAGFVLAFILLKSANNDTKKAAKMSESVVVNLQKKNAQAVYDQFSSESKKTTNAGEIENFLNQVGGFTQDTAKKVELPNPSETLPENKQAVAYEVKGTDGKTYRVTIMLIKEADTWKILNFNKTAL